MIRFVGFALLLGALAGCENLQDKLTLDVPFTGSFNY